MARRKFVSDFGKAFHPVLRDVEARRDRAGRSAVRQALDLPGAPPKPLVPRQSSYTGSQYRALRKVQGDYRGRAMRAAVNAGSPASEATGREVTRIATEGGRDRARDRRLVAAGSRSVARAARDNGFASSKDYLAWRNGQKLSAGKAGKHRTAGGAFQIAGVTSADIGRVASRKVLPVAAATPQVRDFAKKTAIATGKDIASLPVNVPVGAYYTGRAAVKAAQGDTSEAKGLWKDFKENDPVALAAQGKLREAAVKAGQHPGLAAIEVLPMGGSAVRGVQRAGRIGRAGRLARVTERRVPNTNIVEAPVRGRLTRAPMTRGRRDVNRVPERYIEHRVDQREALAQSQRRPARAETAEATRQALREPAPSKRRRGRPVAHPDVVSLVSQGIVKADRHDLERFAGELDAAHNHPRMTRDKKRANRQTKAAVQAALDDPKLDMESVRGAAHRVADAQRPLERELVDAKMIDPHEAEKARLTPYAVRQMGARHVQGAGMVRAEHVADAERLVGELRSVQHAQDLTPRERGDAAKEIEQQISRTVLPPGEIRDHMVENGLNPEKTAFVSHAPGAGGDGAFNVSSRRPQGIAKRPRSGEAVSLGMLDTHPERLVEQNVKMRGLVDANRHFKGFVSEVALRRGDGGVVRVGTRGEADQIIRNLSLDKHGDDVPDAHEFVAIKAEPWAGRAEQLQQTMGDVDAEGFVSDGRHPVSEALTDALKGKGGDEGGWVIVPKVAARRLEEHATVVSGSSPVNRVVTQAFRKTVLPLSPSWLMGNVAEGVVRTAINRAGFRSLRDFRRVHQELAKLDPEKAAEFLHRTPSGHYGGTHESMIHTSVKQFEGKRIEPLARAFDQLRRAPGPRHLANAYGRYVDLMMGTVNAAVESQFTRAMAGRHIRKELMSRADRQVGETAVEQAARGLLDTNEQARMADAVTRAYGQYEGFGPDQRKMIMNYTPFGAWVLSATRFLALVLPRDHPALTALMVANHNATMDTRAKQGLEPYSDGALPTFLQGSIPTPRGGHRRVARFTPFGLGPDPFEAAANAVLPQYASIMDTAAGRDWKGKELKGPNGEELDPGSKTWIATREFLLATVPVVNQALRIKKDGLNSQNPVRVIPPSKRGASPASPAGRLLRSYGAQEAQGPSAEELLKQYGVTEKQGPSAEELLKKYGGAP